MFENEKDSVVDEYGMSEPMDYIVNEKKFCLESLSSHTQYLAQLPSPPPLPENEKEIEVMQVKKK